MRHVLALATIFLLGCGDGTSPVPPTAPTLEFSLSGGVVDTAFRPVADARVEVVDGPRAGVFALTDASGRYALPGVFSDTITVRASKDEYISVTKTYQTAFPGRQDLSFSMELSAPSVNIAGDYTLTLTADSACSELPAVARSRTYAAAIVPSPTLPHQYEAVLSGATFYPSALNDRLGIGVAGSFAHILVGIWWDSGVGIAEELAPSTYVAIAGGAAASVGGSSISGALAGWFEYCAGPGLGPGLYRCGVAPVTCRSSNHRLTLRLR